MNHPATDTLTAAPPVAVSSATLLGYPVADWVLWLNLIYVVILIIMRLTRKSKD